MTRRKSYKLGDIVGRFGGELIGDPQVRVSQVATVAAAGPSDITFISQARYLAQLKESRAGAVIVGADARGATAAARIVCANPYAYFAKVSALLNPVAATIAGIHKAAAVDKSARIDKTAGIAAAAVIGKRVRIGKRVHIGAGCFIGDDSVVGEDTTLHANVAVYQACRIGARCTIHAGAVIGADGFGIAREDGAWKKIPQIGGVVIGDDVEIGANTTIDRGTLEDTVIGDGVKLDNQIQVAHNVRIGAHTAIAACVGIAGSATIGSNCQLGGAAMIYGHITIADNVNISAGTLVMKSLEQPGTYTGVYPFSTHERWLKNAAQLRKLDELAQRVRELERKPGTDKGTKP
ncbi:MAG: UDP-3-O-(3-hydroxymyristoyl)glucosamine N-acyltransferase [Burkholderiales bacterium]